MFYRINESSIPHHTSTVVIICGANNLDREKPSDITNGLICAVVLLQLKHKKLKIFISVILPRNKGKKFQKEETDRNEQHIKIQV